MAKISPSLIVLLVIIGCIVAVTIGYAFSRLLGFVDDEGVKERTPEQDRYMQDVRRRNLEQLYKESPASGIRRTPASWADQ